MTELTPYETRVRQDIDAWRDAKEGRLTRALAAFTKPLAWALGKLMPRRASDVVQKAVMGFMEMLHDGAQWTYPDSGIIKEARKAGLEVSDYRELRTYDLEQLDPVARRFFTSNKILAALEGAGCGLGGFVLIAADIPALFTLTFRAVQQIGASYGFDMEDPEMFPIVMSIFSAGSSSSTAAKAATLADMRVAAQAFGKNWTYKKVAEHTQTGVVARLLKERTKHLPKDIANNVTKRKLGQLIPILGAAVGAGFNYWFMSNTTRTAYMVFRDLHLHQKSGGAGEPTGAPAD